MNTPEELYVVQTQFGDEWRTLRLVGDDPAGLTIEEATERAWRGIGCRIRPVNCMHVETVSPLERHLIWGGRGRALTIRIADYQPTE